jgi:hypothetical protein
MKKNILKKMTFYAIIIALMVGVIEIVSYSFFNLFESRFTFFGEKYSLKDDKLKFLVENYDAKLGWERRFDTPYQERPLVVSYNKPLIATFGDSFTHCDQVKDHETWQTYLSDLLKADVYNFGSSGHGTDQVYLKFLSHYPKIKTPIVTLGLITENINRIVNVYRPFYFPKTLLWFTKPRFKLVKDQLILLENPIKSTEEYLRKLREPKFIESLGKDDWWYGKDNYPQLQFPYLKILFNKRIWLEAYYGKGNQRVDDMSPRPWENLWKEKRATELMFKIMASFVQKAKSDMAKPILMVLPMKHEVISFFKKKTLPEKVSIILTHCQTKGYLCFETISALANSVNSVEEIETLYQGHVSPKGNRIIAKAFFDFFIKSLPNSQSLEVVKTDNGFKFKEVAKDDFKVDSHFKEKLSESHFKSYHEFAEHACIPCHYGENGTNLVKPIEMMTESDLKNYLDAMLNNSKMPPDEVFRKILLGKLNFLKKRL